MGDEQTDGTLSLYELVRDGNARKLISYLESSTNPRTRSQAANRLGELGEQSNDIDQDAIVDALVTAALGDASDDVRARAVGSLDRCGREALRRLIDRLSEATGSDRGARETLVRWLGAEATEFRLVAASALGRVGDERTVPRLVDSFDDLDPRVRERAVRACGRVGDPRAVESISARLSDDEPAVRRAAAEALATIGTPAALERLIPAARARDRQTRYVAVSELGRLESAEPLDVLVDALADDSREVRRAATLSVVELLAADTSGDAEIRRSVTEQLETVDDTELIERLLDVLSEVTRVPAERAVVWLLGRSVSPEAGRIDAVHDRLLERLDVDPLADEAEESLAELESRTLEDRLLVFIQRQNPSPEARERAERLLDRIETDRVDDRVRDAVEYVYVREPADYTRRKENSE